MLQIRENKPLAPLTTLGVGGAARIFAEVSSDDEVIEAFEYAATRDLPVFVLGGGSNILVSDQGFDGLVIRISNKGILSENLNAPRPIITVSAGENWDKFVAYCVENDLAGVECLSGIPGSVGGTPVQNVGAYGQEVSETIVSVHSYDRNAGRFVDLVNRDCCFAYRTSIFNTTERDRYVVLGVVFQLRRGGEPRIEYKDLRERFEGKCPTLAGTREAVLDIRRSKSMVIDENDPNSQSAGSFFKNPVIEEPAYRVLKGKFPDIPCFPADPGRVKVPAAWLIERAGFNKGFVLGNAGLSTNHTLAIINRGHASAEEIVALKSMIQHKIRQTFGIELQPEPVFVGF